MDIEKRCTITSDSTTSICIRTKRVNFEKRFNFEISLLKYVAYALVLISSFHLFHVLKPICLKLQESELHDLFTILCLMCCFVNDFEKNNNCE